MTIKIENKLIKGSNKSDIIKALSNDNNQELNKYVKELKKRVKIQYGIDIITNNEDVIYDILVALNILIEIKEK